MKMDNNADALDANDLLTESNILDFPDNVPIEPTVISILSNKIVESLEYDD